MNVPRFKVSGGVAEGGKREGREERQCGGGGSEGGATAMKREGERKVNRCPRRFGKQSNRPTGKEKSVRR